MKPSIRGVAKLLLPAMLALLTGCAALPDMTPYRDATLQLRSTVVAGGNAVQSGLESAAASYEKGDATATKIREEADKFNVEWQARIKGADALVAYSEAVTDIEGALGLGWSRGKVIFTVFGNLANKPFNDPTWGGTAQQFDKQIAVAKVYSEVLLQSTTHLETLRDVLAPVTPTTDVSSQAKIVELIGQALMDG